MLLGWVKYMTGNWWDVHKITRCLWRLFISSYSDKNRSYDLTQSLWSSLCISPVWYKHPDSLSWRSPGPRTQYLHILDHGSWEDCILTRLCSPIWVNGWLSSLRHIMGPPLSPGIVVTIEMSSWLWGWYGHGPTLARVQHPIVIARTHHVLGDLTRPVPGPGMYYLMKNASV